MEENIVEQVKNTWNGVGRVIGKGNYRIAYIHKGTIVKKIFRKSIRIKNINLYEFQMYQALIPKIPIQYQNYFSSIYGVFDFKGETFSVSELIRDYDGEVSKSLNNYKGGISNDYFWMELDKLKMFLIDNKIEFVDVAANNIIVKKINENLYFPIFIDYKRVGNNIFFPLQLSLYFKKGRVNKMIRRFNRLIRKYQIVSEKNKKEVINK